MKKHIAFSLIVAATLFAGLFLLIGGNPASASHQNLPAEARAGTYRLSTTDGLTLTLSADGLVTGLQIGGRELVAAPGPALTLRDLSQAGQVDTPNLLANPGFEDGLDQWHEALNQGLEVSVVLSPTHSGGHALAFTNDKQTTAVAGYAGKLVAVAPGQRYRLSAWFLSSTGYITHPMGTPPLMQMKIWQKFQPSNGIYVMWYGESKKSLGAPELVTPLHTNATRWRLIRGEVTAPLGATRARFVVGARLSDQTLWVDDAAFVPSPERELSLSGVVAPCPGQGGCLQQTATLTNGLAITVTYTADADHIAVHADIADTTGQNRALDVGWGVPVVMAGGTWWDDAHTARTITGTRRYANEISAIYDGWQSMSLYPYAGVQIGEDAGLALGLPLDRPQVALLSYDGRSNRYSALYHLGISPQAVKVGPHATFDLMLYRFDPSRGFRDVIARHQKMQASAYTTPRAQGLYDYQGRSQGQYYTRWGAHTVRQEDDANVYSAQYTSSDLVLRVARSEKPRPTMDDIMHVLTLTLHSPYTESVALAQAITNSATVDPDGEWSLKQVGVFAWDTGHWEAAWAGDVDPDIERGLAPFLMDYRIDRAFSVTTRAGAHLDGVQIDNFMTTPTFDLRPEALAAADWPLGYTPHTYQPAVHTGFAQEEFLAYLRRYLDEKWGRDRGITVNFWGLGHPNYLGRYIDGFGSEGQLQPNGEGENFNPQILDYRRALAAKRPYLFTVQASGVTAVQAYTTCQLALLYGVHPGHGPNGHGWDPAADRIISDTARLVGRYWAAGWEPLTYARADDDRVWIERFGRVATFSRQESGNGLYFTVHNRSDMARTATVTMESTPLGIADPAAIVLTDIAITQTIPFNLVNGDIRFDLPLGPRQTRVVRVSGGVQQPTPSPTPTASPVRFYVPLMIRESDGL